MTKFEYDNIIYMINEEEQTSCIVSYNPKNIDNNNIIIIPLLIKYKLKEYFVIGISKGAFMNSVINSINFGRCSKLQSIGEDAFVYSRLKSIKIPSHVLHIGKYAFWNSMIQTIEFEKDSKLQIIEKSAFEGTLIKNITIPSNVTKIGENAFSCCSQLKTVEFANDSKLQIIQKYAFMSTPIESIRIPSNVIKIGKNVFQNCNQLQTIEFTNDSKLQTIDSFAFDGSSIESITIPANTCLIDEWCSNTPKLNKINVCSRNKRYCCYDEKLIIGKSEKSNNYNCLICCVRNIDYVTIPSFVECICPFAFDGCAQIQKIEFLCDSKLQIIRKNAFINSSIQSISIPSEVTTIEQYAFYNCRQLKQVNIPDNSQLKTIGTDAFMLTSVEDFTIPSQVLEFQNGWYSLFSKAKKIKVNPKNPIFKSCDDDKIIIGKSTIEKENYDCIFNCIKGIKTFVVPNFIEHICMYAFSHCNKLQKINIPNDSKLQTIDKYSFSNSSIEKISIPSQVIEIGEHAFDFCTKLKIVEIPCNSNLQTIGVEAFSRTPIVSISIPSQVTQIGESAFGFCYNLQIIEINEDSKLKSLNENSFNIYGENIFMIPVNLSHRFNI